MKTESQDMHVIRSPPILGLAEFLVYKSISLMLIHLSQTGGVS